MTSDLIKAKLLKECVLDNEYIPHKPTKKQAEFLVDLSPEVLFGGAMGGGKSDALFMAALMFVHIKDYSALILRKTYTDLSLPGALIDRSHSWLDSTDAKWNEQLHQWRFPSGATLTFGYLDTSNAKYRYQSSEFQYVGFDELTQFEREEDYTYLFTRLRKLKSSNVPLRMRAATNPGGAGESWVYRRFFKDQNASRRFIPSRLEDNPYLDANSYEHSLSQLDPITRRQLREGIWNVKVEGNLFKSDWFKFIELNEVPRSGTVVRFWDLAATEFRKNNDPDYTAGVRVRLCDGVFYIEDVIKVRKPPGEIERLIHETAKRDGHECIIAIEQEPGAAGKIIMNDLSRRILTGYIFYPVKISDPKLHFAKIFSAACYNGNVHVVNSSWTKDFVDECVAFPSPGVHDDAVDAASKAIVFLSQRYAKQNEVTDFGVYSCGDYEIDEVI